MDVIEDLGHLGLGIRLRRLSDRLMRDATAFYRNMEVDFRAGWFPVAWALRQHSPQTVTELAQALGLSHPAVNQVLREMRAADIVVSSRDRRDERRRPIRLSRKGRRIIAKLEPIWQDMSRACHKLIEETPPDLLEALRAVEAGLDETPLYARIIAEIWERRRHALEIVDYEPRYRRWFEELNRESLAPDFEVGAADAQILADPRRHILHRGGAVLFARLDRYILGTCALVRLAADSMELSKLAVRRNIRGYGVGRLLAEAAIARARGLGTARVFLRTSPELEAAVHLYRSLGFVPVDPDEHPLAAPERARCPLSMVLDLHDRNPLATAD